MEVCEDGGGQWIPNGTNWSARGGSKNCAGWIGKFEAKFQTPRCSRPKMEGRPASGELDQLSSSAISLRRPSIGRNVIQGGDCFTENCTSMDWRTRISPTSINLRAQQPNCSTFAETGRPRTGPHS